MSTLRINNIEAQSIPASPTLDEKVKITNSSGDILVNIDGKTSGITTIGINTTDGNIKFDENSNVVVTGVVTATKFSGDFEPVHVNASGIVTASSFVGTGVSVVGVVTATSFVGSGANLTNLPDQSFDDDKIVNDISTLALKVSALENSTASNTNSTFVDTYQDSAGISTITNAGRSTTGEFVASVYDTVVTYQFDQAGTHGQPGMLRINSAMGAPVTGYWAEERTAETGGYIQASVNFAFDLSGDFTHFFYHKVNGSGQATSVAYPNAGAIISPRTTITSGKNPTYNGSQGGGIMNLRTNSGSYYVCYNIGYGSNNGKAGVHTPGVSDCNTNSAWSAPTDKWVWMVVRTSGSFASGNVEIMHRAYDANSWTTDADSNGGTTNEGTVASGEGRLFRHASNSYTNDYDNTYVAHMGFWNAELNDTQLNALFNNGKTFDWSSNSGNYTLSGNLQEYFKMDEGSGSTLINSGNGGNATKQSGSGSWDADSTQIGTASATGNFISNVITASASTNKIGVVITYTDSSGTATLNTDLKVSLSADNGSNFTQVTLVAQPNFATGVKMALANDVTVTAGTLLKYKVEFANQAAGSKETRVTGVSLQY